MQPRILHPEAADQSSFVLLELNRLIHPSALRAARTIHIRVIGINVAATAAPEDAVLGRRRLKAPAAQLGVDSHARDAAQQSHEIGEDQVWQGHELCVRVAHRSWTCGGRVGERHRNRMPFKDHPAPSQVCHRVAAPARFAGGHGIESSGFDLPQCVLISVFVTAAWRKQNWHRRQPTICANDDLHDAFGQEFPGRSGRQ